MLSPSFDRPDDRPTSPSEGYHAPQNLQHYAIYLDSRIRAYRDMKHDAVQVQSEHNRDMRLSKGVGQDMSSHSGGGSSKGGLQRGKTLAGRKLRVMTVEKGLLRETKAVQKQIDALVECRVRFQCCFDRQSWACN